MRIQTENAAVTRWSFVKSGLLGVGVSAGLPAFLSHAARAETARIEKGEGDKHPNRILVVLELAGGNDGLNTVVPYTDDAYYKARPTLGIRKNVALPLNDQFALHGSLEGLSRLFKDGSLAIVHGCGYPNPNLSHFTAMEWWHTAVPHGSDPYGWLGRFADAHEPNPKDSYIVNINDKESLAIHSAQHSPVIFKDPKKFARQGTEAQEKVFAEFGKVYKTDNPSLRFVSNASRTASIGSSKIRSACAEYRTTVDYGSDNDLTLDLKKVAAMIAADLPTRIYYVGMGGYDTHAAQAGSHQILLIYLADAIRGFMDDLKRMGRADDVAMMAFTEFGRRVGENASKGTDHGTAGPMFVIGKPVRGGFYGTFPSLTKLADGNLVMTTDFRDVYATMLKGWMGFDGTNEVLKGDWKTLPIFG